MDRYGIAYKCLKGRKGLYLKSDTGWTWKDDKSVMEFDTQEEAHWYMYKNAPLFPADDKEFIYYVIKL